MINLCYQFEKSQKKKIEIFVFFFLKITLASARFDTNAVVGTTPAPTTQTVTEKREISWEIRNEKKNENFEELPSASSLYFNNNK